MYECIGGPWCGQKAPQLQPGLGFVVVEAKTNVHHFYRLCVSTRRYGTRIRKARFWHYMGTRLDTRRRPKLAAPEKLFR